LLSRTKSEHDAIFLITKDKGIRPSSLGRHAFQDPELERLLGKRFLCTGKVTGYTLLITDCTSL
jgi:hypothetical protein